MWVQSLGQEDSLDKEMATFWEIPWTEGSAWPHSKGSQRVGHNLSTKTTTICIYVRLFHT